MNTPVYESSNPLTLVGGGDCTNLDLELARSIAPVCVAADSGADHALQAGLEPVAVIGDMDSISDRARVQIPADRMHHIAEQDSTDFDKTLRNCVAPLVIAVGFSGGRVDHTLAALHTLVTHSDRLVIILSAEDITFVCPPRMSLPLESGTRFSLFPMGPVEGSSQGLHWPIDGLAFAPGMQSGTSNLATGPVSLSVTSPNMLCILPRASILPVASVFLELPASARWPARAR